MADEPLPPAPAAKEREHRHPLPLVIKIAEVAISIFIIGLIVDPFNANMKSYNKPRSKLDDVAAIYVAIGGYMVINLVIIIGWLLGDIMPKKTSILFSAVGSLLHVVAASLMVYNWRKTMNNYIEINNHGIRSSKQYNDMLISGAVFAYVNAVVFGIDVLATMRYT